jgi:hypothetical protein
LQEAGEDSIMNVVRVIESRGIRWAGCVALTGERPLGRPRHRWEDNIRMDLREIGWDSCGSG